MVRLVGAKLNAADIPLARDPGTHGVPFLCPAGRSTDAILPSQQASLCIFGCRSGAAQPDRRRSRPRLTTPILSIFSQVGSGIGTTVPQTLHGGDLGVAVEDGVNVFHDVGVNIEEVAEDLAATLRCL